MRTFEQTTKQQLIKAAQSLMSDSTDTQDYLNSLNKDELATLICQLA
tara:strand:- start:328 stop:468 length:141 start_codon:yes stop_codon:yes gene_type:complete